jgi:sigma-B regulation protein RsbU (phosphoserine phosphatase)
LAANLDSRSFITMTYAVVDPAARRMRLARAGHSPLLHLEASSARAHVVAPPGLGLGLDRGERFDAVLEEAEVELGSGDVFLFFTDGLSEAMSPDSELYGEERLRSALEAGFRLEAEELRERILGEIDAFVAGGSVHDDLTLVILKVD